MNKKLMIIVLVFLGTTVALVLRGTATGQLGQSVLGQERAQADADHPATGPFQIAAYALFDSNGNLRSEYYIIDTSTGQVWRGSGDQPEQRSFACCLNWVTCDARRCRQSSTR